MTHKRWLAMAVGLGLAGTVGVVLAANITIDDFNSGTTTLNVDDGTTYFPYASEADATGLGGSREAELQMVAENGDYSSLTIDAGSGAGNDRLGISNGPEMQTVVTITWDGIGIAASGDPVVLNFAMGSKDFTDGGTNGAFRLREIWNDTPMPITLIAYTTDAANYKTYSFSTAGTLTGSVDIIVPFTNFSTVGDGTFSDVDAFRVIISSVGAPAADLTMDDISVVSTDTLDYGDLPAIYAITTFEEDGARHILTDTVRLGVNKDGEGQGQSNSTATGDNLADVNDEDGITHLGHWSVAQGGQLASLVNGCAEGSPCYLNGWIDFNQDNDFSDPGEVIFTDTVVTNGQLIHTFSIPRGTNLSNSTLNMRYRICATAGQCNRVTGLADGGEVEDYQIILSPTAVTFSKFEARANNLSLWVFGVVLGLGLLLLGFAWVLRRSEQMRQLQQIIAPPRNI